MDYIMTSILWLLALAIMVRAFKSSFNPSPGRNANVRKLLEKYNKEMK